MTITVREPGPSGQQRTRMPGQGSHASKRPASEERWLPSVCTMCYNGCSIQVLVRDGVATAIEGLPGVPPNHGRMCAKGKSALAELYNPRRITRPLRRTNPEKGLGVDPKWQEITWEEALNAVAEKLKEAHDRYPGSVSISTFDNAGVGQIVQAFLAACGGGRYGLTVPTSQYLFCGRGVHPISHILNGSADRQPDLHYCQYLLVLGGGFGTGTGTHAMHMARALADARVDRGIKMVVVDPCRTSSGGRADEWIPIIPGTDAAFCLAVVNVLVNELGIYDKEFLRSYTNGSYLIRPNGHYARDPATGKPLVLSMSKEGPVPYDAVVPEDVILEGEDEVGGEKVRTAFVMLREHLRRYTPEYVSQVTTVPPATIRRIAQEFGAAAQMGATTVIDGVELPLRPACALWYRGLGQHQHGMHNAWAAAMLNITIGAVSVPGGCCDTGAAGPWGLPGVGPDGLLVTTGFTHGTGGIPPKPAKFDPHDPSLEGMFPTVYGTSSMGGLTLRAPEKYKMDYPLKVWINCRNNPMKTAGDPEETAEILKKIPFQLSFVQHHEETSEFADVILPDAHYLERLMPFSRNPYNNFQHTAAPGDKESTFASQQPVVQPMGEARNWAEVLWELAHRAGLADDLYTSLNTSLQLDPEHRLERGRRYTYEEFCDKWMRSWCGEEHGLEYFLQRGYAVAHEGRQVQHDYPRPFHKGRIPLYLEHWLTAGESVRDVVKEKELEWGDLSDYEPLVNYRSCWASQEGGETFPLYLVSPKVGFLSLSTGTIRNPHLQDIAQAMGEIFNLGIHPATAKTYGITDGDTIELETPGGKKTTVLARVTSDVHPKVVVAPGNVARVLSPDGKDVIGEGVHINSFLSYRLERIDMVSAALDACVKVRIRKVDGTKQGGLAQTLKNAFGIGKS